MSRTWVWGEGEAGEGPLVFGAGEKETGRRGDGETGRRGDGETGDGRRETGEKETGRREGGKERDTRDSLLRRQGDREERAVRIMARDRSLHTPSSHVTPKPCLSHYSHIPSMSQTVHPDLEGGNNPGVCYLSL